MKEAKKFDAREVGGYISPKKFQALSTNYQDNFPSLVNAVQVKKDLIISLLKSSSKVAGIHFVYGLKDRLNPNSLCIFLIPCISSCDEQEKRQPLASKHGYYDHEGKLHSIIEIAEMERVFVDYYSKELGVTYKETTSGTYWGIRALLRILTLPSCAFIQFSLGLEANRMPAVLQPFSAAFEPVREVYIGMGQLSTHKSKYMATLARDSFFIEAEEAALNCLVAPHHLETLGFNNKAECLL